MSHRPTPTWLVYEQLETVYPVGDFRKRSRHDIGSPEWLYCYSSFLYLRSGLWDERLDCSLWLLWTFHMYTLHGCFKTILCFRLLNFVYWCPDQECGASSWKMLTENVRAAFWWSLSSWCDSKRPNVKEHCSNEGCIAQQKANVRLVLFSSSILSLGRVCFEELEGKMC